MSEIRLYFTWFNYFYISATNSFLHQLLQEQNYCRKQSCFLTIWIKWDFKNIIPVLMPIWKGENIWIIFIDNMNMLHITLKVNCTRFIIILIFCSKTNHWMTSELLNRFQNCCNTWSLWWRRVGKILGKEKWKDWVNKNMYNLVTKKHIFVSAGLFQCLSSLNINSHKPSPTSKPWVRNYLVNNTPSGFSRILRRSNT